MKKTVPLMILAACAVAVGSGYVMFFGDPAGVSPLKPLGDFETIDRYLTESLQLTKEETKEAIIPVPAKERKKYTTYRYVHTMTHNDIQLREVALVTVDGEKTVRAIGGSFQYMAAMDDPTFFMTKVPAFVIGLWRTCGGPKTPTWSREVAVLRQGGVGAPLPQQVYVARFDQGGVHGEWMHNREWCTILMAQQ